MFLLNLHASYHGFNLLSLRKDIDLCSEEEDVYWFVGMVSLNALLLVCSGFDRWGSWWSRSIEERWVGLPKILNLKFKSHKYKLIKRIILLKK